MQSGCCGALLRMQGGVAGPPCPALDGEHAFLRCCIKSPGAVSPWESGLVEVSWRQGNACCPKCGQSVSVVLLLTHMSDELGASLATELDTPLIHLIGFLRSPVQEEVEDALFTLSEMVSYSFDRDGARLCEIMRTHGGLTQLSWILADSTQPIEMHQQALLLLGNLCSDSVDPASMLSKQLLLTSGVERYRADKLLESKVNVVKACNTWH